MLCTNSFTGEVFGIPYINFASRGLVFRIGILGPPDPIVGYENI